MNDDELKQLWQQQPLREPDPSAAQLVSAMQSKTTLLRRCLAARDLVEILACAFVIIVFGYFYFTVYRSPTSRVGVLIIIGGAIFIAWKLIHARWANPPAPPGSTLVASLRAELKSVRAQSRLLGSVLWWYVAPLTIGVTIATWGLPIHLHGKIPVTLVFFAVGVIVYWLNQWARAKQLLPLEAELESLLYSAETGEPLEETQAAKLCPIALSLAAADQVKPVEFGGSFWQFAFWGEIAFIGIWFFLMIVLTIAEVVPAAVTQWETGDDGGWIFALSSPAREIKEQKVETPVQTDVEEISRYSAVARKVIDLLNARDHAGVQKLYAPAMSKAFPPKETSDFYTRLAAKYGNIEKFDGPTTGGYRGWIAFRLHCRDGELTMSLALDANDEIAGIYFRPVPRPTTVKSIVLLFFSWQHLIWIVPFFLAGVVYAWWLQKMSQRAVGISTLGVHLHQGQKLFLWDEIKEVRLFKLLNIRSLWLIREPGEQASSPRGNLSALLEGVQGNATMMPWTGLERHSDLKKAVENFAPADHPIRDYLSLL